MKKKLPDNFTVLIGGEKGGTGKSTIATNMALMLKLAGYDTHLVDCDKQMSSLKLSSRRSANEIKPQLICTHLQGDQLQVPLADLSEKYEAVVIDSGGQDSVELRSAMISPSVTLLVVPIQPGFFDVETLMDMNKLVSTSKIYNPNLEARCLISRASTHYLDTTAEEARVFIQSELNSLKDMKTVIRDRKPFGYSVATGECVYEYELRTHAKEKKATSEICDLFQEITGFKFINSYEGRK
ncbi:MAG: hypothetical protein HC851_18725 [Acaryochloris sp. RU_4_1]|nr:hypothetical protein [Acaryochloris sp. RU_4_1]NJR57059.1 hypothetical protein [Acaryochloris sp. CRU_2_0]